MNENYTPPPVVNFEMEIRAIVYKTIELELEMKEAVKSVIKVIIKDIIFHPRGVRFGSIGVKYKKQEITAIYATRTLHPKNGYSSR